MNKASKQETYTEDFSKFGNREIKIASELLTAYIEDGLPVGMEFDGLKIGFNMNSGFVFLINENYDVAMTEDGKTLYAFYTSPYEGKEGTYEELKDEYEDMHPDDQEWFDGLEEPKC